MLKIPKAPLSEISRLVVIFYLVNILATQYAFSAEGTTNGGSGPALSLPGLGSSPPSIPPQVAPTLSDSSAFASDLAPSDQPGRSSSNVYSNPKGTGSEYISGYYQGAVLMPITILGSVQKPGIHNIPTRTSLLKLLALAGGPSSDALLSDLTIKRFHGEEGTANEKEELIKVDVQQLLASPLGKGPVLQRNDVIILPQSKPLISNNALQTIGFISSVLGILVSGFVLVNYKKQ